MHVLFHVRQCEEKPIWSGLGRAVQHGMDGAPQDALSKAVAPGLCYARGFQVAGFQARVEDRKLLLPVGDEDTRCEGPGLNLLVKNPAVSTCQRCVIGNCCRSLKQLKHLHIQVYSLLPEMHYESVVLTYL
jgi:hypothetical protein